MKKFFLAAALALTLATSSTRCLGPDNALSQYKEWNNHVTDEKWLNELNFIPGRIVAWFFWSGDMLIFNSMEFWGAENPIKPAGGQPIHVKQ